MNTPTEAHLDLALKIAEAIARSGNVAAAQLIADSEARAVLKQTAYLKAMVQDGTNAMKERDQLRAQLRALTLICGTNDANKFETWIDRANARAERAEAAQTVALANWNGALERAMKAEAELAAAKERLRSEAMDDYASIKDLQRELATERARLNAGTILLTVAGERVWHCGVDLRAAIDAAMKEREK